MKIKVLLVMLALFSATMLLQAKEAENFVLPDIDNNEVSLSELIGEGLVLLDFWATWCQPCMRLMPELEKIHTDYEEVKVVGVNIDNPRSLNRAKNLVRSNRFSFITLYDTDQEVMKRYQVTSIPHTIILDKEGRIVYEHIGYQRGDERELREVIEREIAKLEGAE